MSSPAPPVFGKRGSPTSRAPAAAPVVAPAALDPAAFFAEARREIADADSRLLVVPRSFRAAILAGLVIGCCLAGLDVTRADDTLRHLSGGLLGGTDTSRFLPIVILLGLAGGARAAATNLLVSHSLLRCAGWTSHIAYACGGGALAAGLSWLALTLIQTGLVDGSMLPSRGVAVDAVSGAGAGFFYRVFAGARRV